MDKRHAKFLLNILDKYYAMVTDQGEKLYCGITLDWHYEECHVSISMPNSVYKNLVK